MISKEEVSLHKIIEIKIIFYAIYRKKHHILSSEVKYYKRY